MHFVGIRTRRRGLARLLLATTLALGTNPAWGQAPAPSTNAMVNLIELLSKQGVITKESGEALIAQAEAEAERARESGPAVAGSTPGVKRELVRQEGYAGPEPTAPQVPAQLAEAPPPPLPPAPAGTLRVPYVPEVVRKQIAAEVKKEILGEAQQAGWAQPGLVPQWVKGVTISGDVRFRGQADLYSKRNTDGLTGLPTDIFDYNQFNENGPIDINARQLQVPFINTRTDRIGRMRIRARLGVDAAVSPIVGVGMRLATGDDASPVSTNQILGGGLGKKDIWLDRAYLRVAQPEYGQIVFGRFENPFRSTELLFDQDLNFDGISATLERKSLLTEGTTVALTLGAFPLDFGSNDFPANDPVKARDQTKWLFSAQLRGGFEAGNGLNVEAAVAYHSFKNVEGKLSDPCDAYIGGVQCSTDQLRPRFVRKGNSLFYMRNVNDDPTTVTGNDPQPQFLGLVFDYDILDINASASMPIGNGIIASLNGNYVRNLSFRRGEVCRYAPLGNIANNVTNSSTGNTNPCDVAGSNPARFNGGNQGWLVGAMVGHVKPRRWGEWNVYGNYRRLESDAVLDAYADSDFHLGGTNAKGYVVGGNIGLFDGLTVGARWLSANEVAGPPLSIDVFQLDLSAAF